MEALALADEVGFLFFFLIFVLLMLLLMDPRFRVSGEFFLSCSSSRLRREDLERGRPIRQ